MKANKQKKHQTLWLMRCWYKSSHLQVFLQIKPNMLWSVLQQRTDKMGGICENSCYEQIFCQKQHKWMLSKKIRLRWKCATLLVSVDLRGEDRRQLVSCWILQPTLPSESLCINPGWCHIDVTSYHYTQLPLASCLVGTHLYVLLIGNTGNCDKRC